MAIFSKKESHETCNNHTHNGQSCKLLPCSGPSFHPFFVLLLQIKQLPQCTAAVRAGNAADTWGPQPVGSQSAELLLECLEPIILDVPTGFGRVNGQLLQFHQDVGRLEWLGMAWWCRTCLGERFPLI